MHKLIGNLTLPAGSNNQFFVSAVRNEDGDYEFLDGTQPIETAFTSLVIKADTETDYCLTAKYDTSSTSVLNLYESDCEAYAAIVCRMWKNEVQNCSKPFQKLVSGLTFSKCNSIFPMDNF